MTAQTQNQTVRLRPLTMVDEGPNEVLVGDPDTGTFVSLPTVGAIVIRALDAGATIAEAAAEAAKHAGEPVDVGSFVESLHELGFTIDEKETAPQTRRTAPIQQRGWVVRQPRWAGFLFSPVAWIVYTAALLFSIASLTFGAGSVPQYHRRIRVRQSRLEYSCPASFGLPHDRDP